VNTLSYKTVSVNKENAEVKWYVVDVAGEHVGRISSKIASVLRGKNKPSFTPHSDTGDYVIVINAEKAVFTGKKMKQKEYIRYSLYPGGQKRVIAEDMLERKPTMIMEAAVKGMLPKTKLGRAIFKKMFVYAGGEHPHAAQKPEPLV
jgi:large subunit ribosomal protein L13